MRADELHTVRDGKKVNTHRFCFCVVLCVIMFVIMIKECNDACYLSNVHKRVPSLTDSKLSSQVTFSLCRQQHSGFLLFSSPQLFLKLSPLASRCNLTCLCRVQLRTGLEPSKLRPVAFSHAFQSKNRLVLGTHLYVISFGEKKGKKISNKRHQY